MRFGFTMIAICSMIIAIIIIQTGGAIALLIGLGLFCWNTINLLSLLLDEPISEVISKLKKK